MLPVLLLSLCLSAPCQDESSPAGFPGLAENPYCSSLFEEVQVTPGPAARALAQNIEGQRDGVPFVNVLRWVDARAFRGKVISVGQSARLTGAEPGTSARLWVHVQQADGSLAFQDDGLDQATTSMEWQSLSSVGAVAKDATDLCFGLIVEGTTPVEIGDFQIEIVEEAELADLRYAVPQRWLRSGQVKSLRTMDSSPGGSLQLTSFTPPGHAAGDLPQLWVVRDQGDIHGTFVAGRALLDAMRRGREPAAQVTFVQAAPTASGDQVKLLPSALSQLSSHGFQAATHVLALPEAQGQASKGGMESAAGESLSGVASILTAEAAATYGDLLQGEGYLHSERVHLRMALARHDAGGDAQLAALLFEASLASMEPWVPAPTVRQASHSLAGHDCGHDHSDGSSHDHTHDH